MNLLLEFLGKIQNFILRNNGKEKVTELHIRTGRGMS